MSRRPAALALALALQACGGGNPLTQPADVDNPATSDGRHLSFAYFQACVQPVLATPQAGRNACTAGGCHDSASGTGGALRLQGDAAPQDLAQDAAALRASAMYRNFVSAQGVTVIGNADASLLLAKPRLRNVLHGGGLVFDAESEATRRLAFWISRPVPAGQDEFSPAGAALLGPGGECRTS